MSLDSVLKIHCDYWKRINHEAVLQEVPFVKRHIKPYPVVDERLADNQRIAPEDIDIDRYLGLDDVLPTPNCGNRINTVMPRYPQAWISGMLGCIICASSIKCRALAASACDVKWLADEFRPEMALGSDWYDFLQKCTDALVSYAGKETAVSQFHLHGIIDMLAAFFREEMLCFAMCEYPNKIHKLTEKLAELYITVAKNNMKKRGLWKGGTALNWGIYAPGELLGYQVNASLFSKAMYDKFFIELDTRIFKEFEYSLVHIHYKDLHIIESLCSIDKLSCIQINLDRALVPGWSLNTVTKACRMAQDSGKCVLINGELSQKEVDSILKVLKPQGLMIFYWLPRHREITDIN